MTGGSDGRPPQSAGEALGRAREHGRVALAETLLALQSLLDAASLAASGEPSQQSAALGPLTRTLAGLAADLDPRESGAESLLAALAEALDVEIARWEARAREDADARGVLRAFLGLRELLWELGVRPAGPADAAESAREAAPASPPRSPRRQPSKAGRAKGRPRVQRLRVEG